MASNVSPGAAYYSVESGNARTVCRLWHDVGVSGPSRRTCLAPLQRCLPALLALTLAGIGTGGVQAAPSARALGHVRVIVHGLTLLVPRLAERSARVGDRLFGSDGLRTSAGERASIGFFDGSIVDLNQNTDIVFRSVKVLTLVHGEVAEVDSTGSHRRVETNAAVATAQGTKFAVFITPRGASTYPTSTGVVLTPGSTTVSVVSGVVVVSNPFGSVRVTRNHWTHVLPGKPPTTPTKHNARSDVRWTTGLATP